jgi:hypothetical protein
VYHFLLDRAAFDLMQREGFFNLKELYRERRMRMGSQ